MRSFTSQYMSHRIHRTRVHVAVCSMLSLLASHALAQEQPIATLPTVTVSDENTPALARPAATATLLDLSPFETPASVDIISRKQLEARGDTSLTQAITRAPGISSLGHPGNSGSSLSARGFTDTTSVMRLYDGTRQYGGLGLSFPFDTWSVERIEVLRGPASVIHGDGAIGGVINIIPKKPTRGPIQNEVQLSAGSRNTQGLAFGSGGAINDVLAYRVDVSGNRSDGWVDRGDNRGVSFSGALELTPTPDLLIRLSHATGNQHPMRYFGTPLVNGVQLPQLREQNYNVADSQIRFKDRWSEVSAQWSPNADVVLRSKLYHIRSDRYWRNAEYATYNPTTGLIDRSGNTEIAHRQAQTGNTTDLTWKHELAGLRNQIAVGFDVNDSSFQHTNNTYAGSSGSVDLFNPTPGQFVSDAPFIPRFRNKARQYAIFAEDRIELNDQWSIVGGLRWDHASVSRQDLVANTQAFDRSYSNNGWRVGVVHQWTPDTALYAQFSKAADPISGMLMLSPANSAFDASTGKQVEVGIKQAFNQGRGEWTLAAYQIEKNNLLTRDPLNPDLRQQVGKRSSRGIEGTLAMDVTPALRVEANAALLRARYDDFTEVSGGKPISRNGKVPTDVPERLANIWAGWKLAPQWTLSGGLRHVGKRFADNANTLKLPAYTTADLALQWQPQRDTTVSLRAFNVLDKVYWSTSYYTNTQWFVGEGRRVELVLNQRF